jgi:phospholipase/carboxylesterase
MDTSEPRLVDQGSALEKAGLIHRVLRPEGTGPHPTVVMLHGRGGNEDVMWIFSRALPKGWLVLAPRGIKPDLEEGYAWHPRQRDEWPTLTQFEEATAAVTRFVHALPELYDADPHHIYLMGFSQGAATSYATAMGDPKLIQGIAGLVGFVPVACDAAIAMSALRGLPIYMAAGKRDPLIPVERTESCAKTLREAGADLTYREYDSGHRLNAQAMRDLKAWWRAQAEVVEQQQFAP